MAGTPQRHLLSKLTAGRIAGRKGSSNIQGVLMKLAILVASAALISWSSASVAADLIIETPEAVDTSFVDSGIYLQLLGGVVLERTVESGVVSDDPDPGSTDFDGGYAAAATLGVVVLEGLSLEADALYKVAETKSGRDGSTTSLMANAKYTIPFNDSFSIYAAAGLGMIWYFEDQPSPNLDIEGSGLGYQLIAGASAAVTEDISLLGEVRYQNTFEWIEDVGGDFISSPTVTVLAGLKISF
jgi:opacity protein-like surface antigen